MQFVNSAIDTDSGGTEIHFSWFIISSMLTPDSDTKFSLTPTTELSISTTELYFSVAKLFALTAGKIDCPTIEMICMPSYDLPKTDYIT